eukprot:SAG31_NODE_1045_length_10180_cov_5.454221_9_plen_88_part_00
MVDRTEGRRRKMAKKGSSADPHAPEVQTLEHGNEVAQDTSLLPTRCCLVAVPSFPVSFTIADADALTLCGVLVCVVCVPWARCRGYV